MTKTVTVAPPNSATKPSSNSPKNSENRSIKVHRAYETTQYEATRATPVVDNWAGGVDNRPSTWEEALLDGARRRAAESRRWAERERRTWWDRGPPEE